MVRLITFMMHRISRLTRPSTSWNRETCPLLTGFPPEKSFSTTLASTLKVTEVIIMPLARMKKDSI